MVMMKSFRNKSIRNYWDRKDKRLTDLKEKQVDWVSWLIASVNGFTKRRFSILCIK